MSPHQHDLEDATWEVGLVDAEVKLYLLALIRTEDDEKAQEISGLNASRATAARAWLQEAGVINHDGTIAADVLYGAKHERLAVA